MATLPKTQQAVKTGSHIGPAVLATKKALFAAEQLENPELDHRVHSGRANHNGRASAAGVVPLASDRRRASDHLDSVVEAPPAGGVRLQIFNLIGLDGVPIAPWPIFNLGGAA